MKKWWRNEKLRRYLSTEIGIEYKACLYFFAILFFYSMYLVLQGIYAASLLHMLEMILVTYGMGYLQVLAMGNFDEAESLTGKEALCMLFCSMLYGAAGFLFGWFGRSVLMTIFFVLYCCLLYVCAYLVNKVKRDIDTEQLNVMLQEYQRGGMRRDECHRDEEPDKDLR